MVSGALARQVTGVEDRYRAKVRLINEYLQVESKHVSVDPH